MAMTSRAEWNGLRFEPFPMPELPGMQEEGHWAPFVTEWATGAGCDDSRQKPRRRAQFEVLMTDPGWWETEDPLPIRGESRNLSDSGMYVVAPIGYGLAVGQRYVFQLGVLEAHGGRISHCGTIVRTEMLVGRDEDCVGVGVRFDSPLN